MGETRLAALAGEQIVITAVYRDQDSRITQANITNGTDQPALLILTNFKTGQTHEVILLPGASLSQNVPASLGLYIGYEDEADPKHMPGSQTYGYSLYWPYEAAP